MPNQTITLANTTDDGRVNSSDVWVGSSFYNYVYYNGGSGDERTGLTFPITTQIPSTATVTKAYLRIRNEMTDSAGSSTLSVNLRSASPATVAQWGDGNLPPNTAAGAAQASSQGPITWAAAWYFGEADNNPVNLASGVNSLLASYGNIEVGHRLAIWLSPIAGAGYPGFLDYSWGANPPQLYLEWTEGGGGILLPPPGVSMNAGFFDMTGGMQ